MAAVTICSDFGDPKKIVSHCFHSFPIYTSWSDGTGCMILVSLILGFKPDFLLSSFTLIKRCLSSSSFLPWGWCYRVSEVINEMNPAEAWLRGATLPSRSGLAAKRSNTMSKERRLHGRRWAERSYSTFKVRRSGCEEIPLVQDKGSSYTLLEQPWRNTPRLR